jgi:hypothetical protein
MGLTISPPNNIGSRYFEYKYSKILQNVSHPYRSIFEYLDIPLAASYSEGLEVFIQIINIAINRPGMRLSDLIIILSFHILPPFIIFQYIFSNL